jgi:hypothetical protein
MHPTLVILAAGLGSRYGGLKQLDPLGPAGETMLDYAVFDAIRAGFTRVVFVIRRDFNDAFRTQVGARYAERLAVDYVYQERDQLPAGCAAPATRTKPWGTGHAVWCARDALDGPFAVLNADDFYGRDSLRQLADFLRSSAAPGVRPCFAMVGFRLDHTLSEGGAVSRGVCVVDRAGFLQRVTEEAGIARADVGAGRRFSGDEVVSMNCWAFTPALFPALERQLSDFCHQAGQTQAAEFYLPAAVSAMIAAGEAEVRVLPTRSAWFGVTYRDDRPRVVAALRELAAAGEYPASLHPRGAGVLP